MSDDTVVATKSPSTDGQWDLLNLLVLELKEMGINDIHIDKHGVVIARIPSNLDYVVPTIGFMAHVDTADDVPGNGVKARVIESYNGYNIPLNKEHTIKVEDNEELAQYKGETLIVTDGTTLLGSDDKAGVAAIMAVAKSLSDDPSIPHGALELIFTSDEETGAGMDTFPYDKIRCAYCYTIDGGKRFEVESECFNAATVNVHFSGVSYHLGAARGGWSMPLPWLPTLSTPCHRQRALRLPTDATATTVPIPSAGQPPRSTSPSISGILTLTA